MKTLTIILSVLLTISIGLNIFLICPNKTDIELQTELTEIRNDNKIIKVQYDSAQLIIQYKQTIIDSLECVDIPIHYINTEIINYEKIHKDTFNSLNLDDQLLYFIKVSGDNTNNTNN